MAQERLNQAQFAKRMGYSRQYVNRLVKAGKIRLGEDKKLDFETARAQMVTNADPARAAFSKLTESDIAHTPPAHTEQVTSLTTEQAVLAGPSYQDARTQREIANARKAEMELEELEGRLVDKRQVKEEVFSLFRGLQERLLHLPARVAGKVAVMKEERQVAACLDQELHQLLAETAHGNWLESATHDQQKTE